MEARMAKETKEANMAGIKAKAAQLQAQTENRLLSKQAEAD